MPRRKMLAADEHIANRIAEMAKRRDATVFQTVNSILEQALRADSLGVTLEEIINTRSKLEKAKSFGFTFAIERLFFDVVGLAYNGAKKNLSEMWFETGSWYGKYFLNKGEDSFSSFKEAMDLLTFGRSEFAFNENSDGTVSVSCVGESFTLGYAEVFTAFFEGAFEAFGYKPVTKEVSKGIIHLEFDKSR